MQVGMVTIDGMMVGIVEINLSEDTDIKPNFEGYNPSGRAEGSDTGKGFHHHGLGHSRPSHGADREHRNQHHFPGHSHHPAPGRHHHPGHDQQRSRGDDKSYDIPYSSTGNPFDRSRFAAELEAKPWLKEKIKHISLGENQDPRANAAVLETMMNRAIVRGTSLEAQARRHHSSGVDEGGYYAGYAPGYSNEKSEMVDRNMANALRGSNITGYATDNSSGSLAAREIASGSFKHHGTINGESFFSPGHAEPKLRERWRELNKKAQEHERAKVATPVIDPSIEPM